MMCSVLSKTMKMRSSLSWLQQQISSSVTNQSSRGICFIGNVLYVRLSCIIIGEFFCNVDMSYITVSIWYVVPFLLSFDIKQIDALFHFILKKF